MKTIVNCTICGVACVDSFTMLYPQCTDCGGDCKFYDPETIEAEGDDPQQDLHQESMREFCMDEIQAHYSVEKDLEFSFSMLPLDDDEDFDWWYSHPDTYIEGCEY